MKKTAAILLLGILLFNCAGYRLYTYYMETRANEALEAQLDADNYDQSQLVSIKIPAVHLSYYANTKQFERVDGQVEIDGVPFKYVKRRLYNDSLELICIPNRGTMKWLTAKNEFFNLLNDLQQNGQDKKAGPHPNVSKNFSAEYYTADDLFKLNFTGSAVSKRSFSLFETLPNGIFFAVERPPEIVA